MERRRPILSRIDRALFDDTGPQVDRFGLLLATVVGTLVVLSLIDLGPDRADIGSDIGAIVVAVFVGTMLVLVARASGLARRWRRVAAIIAAFAIASSVIVLVVNLIGGDDTRDGSYQSPIWVIVSVVMPIAVVRRILRHRRVELSTLLGAVSAYLLIAFTFTFAFLTVNTAQTEDFFGRDEPTTSYMYFSLTSIATLGYGDLVATTPLGRLLATSEAVIGQVFLVTLLAALVGLYAQRPRTRDG